LASSSADCTIKLWDLTTTKAIRSYNLHSSKVQAVAWNQLDPTVLLSGGYDRKVIVFDSRAPQAAKMWNLPSDVECVSWDPFDGTKFFVSKIFFF